MSACAKLSCSANYATRLVQSFKLFMHISPQPEKQNQFQKMALAEIVSFVVVVIAFAGAAPVDFEDASVCDQCKMVSC